MTVAAIDCAEITDRASFHRVFKEKFGFPNFYGANMDAWIDCMTSLDAPQDGMTTVHVEKGQVLTLQLDNVDSFRQRCPDTYAALIESSAFVNCRRIEKGLERVLALSFYMS